MSFFDEHYDARHVVVDPFDRTPIVGPPGVAPRPRYLIYRISNQAVISRVDQILDTGVDARQHVVDNYLYDSAGGEKYLVVDLVDGTEAIYIVKESKSLIDGVMA